MLRPESAPLANKGISKSHHYCAYCAITDLHMTQRQLIQPQCVVQWDPGNLKSGTVTKGRPRSYVEHVEIRAFLLPYLPQRVSRVPARRHRGSTRGRESKFSYLPTHLPIYLSILCLVSFRLKPSRHARYLYIVPFRQFRSSKWRYFFE